MADNVVAFAPRAAPDVHDLEYVEGYGTPCNGMQVALARVVGQEGGVWAFVLGSRDRPAEV